MTKDNPQFKKLSIYIQNASFMESSTPDHEPHILSLDHCLPMPILLENVPWQPDIGSNKANLKDWSPHSYDLLLYLHSTRIIAFISLSLPPSLWLFLNMHFYVCFLSINTNLRYTKLWKKMSHSSCKSTFYQTVYNILIFAQWNIYFGKQLFLKCNIASYNQHVGIRIGTLLTGSQIQLLKIIKFIYYSCKEMPTIKFYDELNLAHKTVID